MLAEDGGWRLAGFGFSVTAAGRTPANELHDYSDPFPPPWDEAARPALQYTAPELVGGFGGTATASGVATPAADMFSLGAALYEMLAALAPASMSAAAAAAAAGGGGGGEGGKAVQQLLPVRNSVQEYRMRLGGLQAADLSAVPAPAHGAGGARGENAHASVCSNGWDYHNKRQTACKAQPRPKDGKVVLPHPSNHFPASHQPRWACVFCPCLRPSHGPDLPSLGHTLSQSYTMNTPPPRPLNPVPSATFDKDAWLISPPCVCGVRSGILRQMLSVSPQARPSAAAFASSALFQEDKLLRALQFLDSLLQREPAHKVAFVQVRAQAGDENAAGA
eukprot:352205-Chlamydomonas_euryale.AAC.15